MKVQGTWKKDEEGYMEFETSQLQRLHDTVTDQYYQVYNRHLEEWDDEETAAVKAREEGYEMVTDYKDIEGKEEFATTYKTPSYIMDVWFEWDAVSKKRIYEKGFLKIKKI